MLQNISALISLCREFGTEEYVIAGGGNASLKTGSTLLVKASGTMMAQASSSTFVALDRTILAGMFAHAFPENPKLREEAVKRYLAESVVEKAVGLLRPSVEAPLHNMIEKKFVMHTHPPLVNGMTCARDGEKACRRLFPHALWIPYADPGHTICKNIAQEIERYCRIHKKQPEIIFIQNHGLFAGADSAEQLRKIHAAVFSILAREYRKNGVAIDSAAKSAADNQTVKPIEETIRTAIKNMFIATGAAVDAASGLLTPDHIVYSNAHYFHGEPTVKKLKAFAARRGYSPRVIVTRSCVAGLGETEQKAKIALAMCHDGARIMQLAEAFGGARYLSAKHARFIETWEAEHYRQKVISATVVKAKTRRAIKGAFPVNKEKRIEQAYSLAVQQYSDIGVDCNEALKRLDEFPLSLQCWQGDDVEGFEHSEGLDGSGLLATGSYPGRARNGDELRADIENAFRLMPGRHRVNIHAIYAETGNQKVDRNHLEPKHFSHWVDWAKEHGTGIDFNPTFFAHEKASSGFTLSSRDRHIRDFWIEHGKACRAIGEYMGRSLGSACVVNIWVPDGYKDMPADRFGPRQILKESLDKILSKKMPQSNILDSVESKLFGIGTESYVAGSHEFYLGYAAQKGTLLCLDSGHFHPTESIADKISSTLCSVKGLLLHISRGVRWDSDHVVTLNDEVRQIAREIVRSEHEKNIHIGLDYFDASINRIAAWVIGMRNVQKALLAALLEPKEKLIEYEISGDFTSRLALMEEMKTMPFAAVWDYYCLTHNVPVGIQWLDEIRKYEQAVLAHR